MDRTPPTRFPLLAMVLLALPLAASCGKQEAPAPSQPAAPARQESGSSPAYPSPEMGPSGPGFLSTVRMESPPLAPLLPTGAKRDDVVALVDKKPVTWAELEKFGVEKVGRHNTLMKDPLSFLPSYVRYQALLKEARRRGIPDSTAYRRTSLLREAVLLGVPYQGYLFQNAPIDPESIKRQLPSGWTKMKFRLYGFTTTAEAEAARARLKGPEFQTPEGGLPGQVPVAGKMNPETGWLFPGSGRFDAFDDPYLFTLRKGELSKPVQTGLGPVLALVLDRHDLDAGEQAQYLTDVRRALMQGAGPAYVNQVASAYPVTLDSAVFQRVVKVQLVQGRPASDEVVGKVGDLAVTYRDFLRQGKPNLRLLMLKLPPERWADSLQADFKNFGQTVALGLAARKARWFPAGAGDAAGWKKRLELEQEEVVLSTLQDQVFSEAKATATEEEVRAFYERAKDRFRQKETITVQYYFTPQAEHLTSMSKLAEEGKPFDALSAAVDRQRSPHDRPLKMQEKVLDRDSNELEHLHDALFAMKKGEVKILELPTGFYLVRIAERKEDRIPPYEEVAGEARFQLEDSMRRRFSEQVVREWIEGVSVEMVGEDAGKQKGTPSTANDRG